MSLLSLRWTVILFTGSGPLVEPLLWSTLTRALWVTASAPKPWAVTNVWISLISTNIKKVTSGLKRWEKINNDFNCCWSNQFLECLGWIVWIWSFLPRWSGSEEERKAVETAVQHGSKRCQFLPPCAEEVVCEISMQKDPLCVGKDAVLSITLKNKCSSPRTVTLSSQVVAIYYTGVQKTLVKKDQTCIELKACECEQMRDVKPNRSLEIFHDFGQLVWCSVIESSEQKDKILLYTFVFTINSKL